MVPSSIGKKRLSQEGNFNNIVSEESSEGKGLPQASASPPLPDMSTMPMTTKLPVHICSSPCRLTSATLLLLLTAQCTKVLRFDLRINAFCRPCKGAFFRNLPVSPRSCPSTGPCQTTQFTFSSLDLLALGRAQLFNRYNAPSFLSNFTN